MFNPTLKKIEIFWFFLSMVINRGIWVIILLNLCTRKRWKGGEGIIFRNILFSFHPNRIYIEILVCWYIHKSITSKELKLLVFRSSKTYFIYFNIIFYNTFYIKCSIFFFTTSFKIIIIKKLIKIIIKTTTTKTISN